jgi:hypothetical protein
MCGIFGYSFKHGKLSAARRAVLSTNLARYNDDRGGDSWGVVGINADGPHVSRGLGDLSDNAYELCEYQTLFAHTRSASLGEVTIKNAHPFKLGKILGAHNGYVYNHEELAAKYSRNFPVDSMHLFAHLNENRSFTEVVARGAIEWIKIDDPKTIYLSKLFAGELAVYGIGTEDNVEGIVWSSSYKHLLKALFCAGINEHFRYEVRRGRVYSVNNGVFSIVRDMRLNVTEPVFKKEVVHYVPNADGKAACGSTSIGGWTRDRKIADCAACLVDEEEAPSSDEAGSSQFRKPRPKTAIVPYRSGRVDDITLWKRVYGMRADV